MKSFLQSPFDPFDYFMNVFISKPNMFAFFTVAAVWFCLGIVSKSLADTSPPKEKPNIVVVVIDDLRWDEFGAYGHPFVKTPSMDRIAEEGVLFRNAFCTTPLCSPSRASILSGLYPRSHGIIDNTDRSEESHSMRTFPQRLQKVGYETAFVGKWHMGNDETRRPGFDHWISMKGQGEATDPHLHENGVTKQVEGYVTDLLTDRAVEFVSRERESPFLLFLAHKALHPNLIQDGLGNVTAIGSGGFIPADRHRNLYKDQPIPRALSYGISPQGKPALQRKIANLPDLGPETVTSDQTIRGRLMMLMAVDEGLGRLLASLETIGKLDDTVVIVMSDHGYHYGEHGLGPERRLAYEQTLRIPLLIRYPPLISPGSIHESMVLTIDIAPTLVNLGGGNEEGFHGRSLLPLFEGEHTKWRDRFLVEYHSDTVFKRIDKMGYNAIRTERYKYIRYYELKGMNELYDLEKDPYEMHNVVNNTEYAQVLISMQESLENLRIKSVKKAL